MNEPSGNPLLAEATRSTRWRRIAIRLLLSLLIFASGITVGVGSTLIVVRRGILYNIHHPETMPERLASHLRRRIGLTDQQTGQVQQILRRRQVALQGIRRRFQPQVEHELTQLQREVAEILDSEQRDQWDQWCRNVQSTWLPDMPTLDTANQSPPPSGG